MILSITNNERDLLTQVLCLEEQGLGKIYLVGGVIRDYLLSGGTADKDFDFVVEGEAAQYAAALAQTVGCSYKDFPQFQTAKVIGITKYGPINEVDFVTTRSESYPAPGSLPVVQRGSFDQDIRRRDFTINALAVPLKAFIALSQSGSFEAQALRSEILDNISGLKDLDTRTVRTLHPRSFYDDPTRLFRALRYLVRIGGKLAVETEQEFLAALTEDVLTTISHTRILNELRKFVQEQNPAVLFSELHARQLLKNRPLYHVENAQQIENSLRKLPLFSKQLPCEDRFNLLLLLCYASFSPGQAVQVFKQWQFGKKQLNKFDAVSAESKQYTAEMSTLALAFGFLTQQKNDQYQSELKTRGLLLQ